MQLNNTYIDPTAQFIHPSNVELGGAVLIAPFVILDATNGPITIGDDSDLQDNVLIVSSGDGVTIGDRVIIAHGASVLGSAQIGKAGGLPAFVGFNSIIDGAILEEDSMVLHLAKVAPGITIHSGTAVKSGKFIQTQAEADDPILGKITPVTPALRAFMAAVLNVNVQLAEGYDQLYFEGGILALLGINLNPATDFNPVETLPTLGTSGSEAVTSFRNRIIGNVTLANSLAQLNLVMGNRDSIRADEGSPFVFGTFRQIADSFTAHALEGTGIVAGNNNQFGFHSIIHGGEDTSTGSRLGTTLGSNIIVGDFSVVFRSTIQDGVTLGSHCFIDNTLITAGSIIPDRAIYINNVFLGFVQW